MAEAENQGEKPEIKIDKPAPELIKRPSPHRRRAFKFDRERVAGWISEQIAADISERDVRQQRRMARRQKLMGWMGRQDWPWTGASQVFLPIMQIANLKTRGTLENSLKAIRPIMEAQAKQKRNKGKQESINRILDYQFFCENPGNTLIDNFCGNYVGDEAVFVFSQWVKETQSYHDVRLLPGPPEGEDHIAHILDYLKTAYSEAVIVAMKDEAGWEWECEHDLDGVKKLSRISFYTTDDGKLEAHIVTDMTTHDGPCISVEDFEDIVFPARSANLQPHSAANPRGAPYVARLTTVNCDTIRRRKKDGTYDLLSDEDIEIIEASPSSVGSGDEQEQPKEQKDRMEGVEPNYTNVREDREQAVWFGRLDVDGDGLEEDVIVWLFLKSKIIAKVALLTEIYPGIPIRRPFAHESFIPIPNRVYGLSQDELLESLQDAMQKLIDQHMNWGEITNTPMFFYRASSGLKNEPIYIEPGMGYPLDDPHADVNFPTWPTKDSAYAINTISLLQQFVERIQMFSDVSFGRVPQGKASALRTASTTMALIGQSDSRSEQVLRRIFTCLSDVFSIMHRLNRRFLPDGKEIRVIGKSEQGEDAYLIIKRDDLDADVDWEFKATLINTNKQALSQALDKVAQLALTPFAFQAGLIDVEQMWTLLRDITKSVDLDPDKYWKRPPQMVAGPALRAEEIISMILAGEMPAGKPSEDPQMHLQKLTEYTQSDLFGLMNSAQVNVLKQWMLTVQQRMMQQQQMMAALQQMQGGGQAGGGGNPGGAGSGMPGETGTAANQAIRGSELIDESVGNVQ